MPPSEKGLPANGHRVSPAARPGPAPRPCPAQPQKAHRRVPKSPIHKGPSIYMCLSISISQFALSSASTYMPVCWMTLPSMFFWFFGFAASFCCHAAS